jgi:two-component system CheB/CheR fusion protein
MHVEIADHTVHVRPESDRGRPAPSIDLLLGSAAEAYGEALVAVILTGLGSDGADGARRVKELGGTVIIQNPQTAAHPEMPLSLAPTTIDIVAELEAIGPLLGELLQGTYAPIEPDDDRRLRSLLEQVRARSGIDFSSYKEPTIRRRLQRRMLDTGNPSLEEYARYVRRHPDESERLANSFLIKVTDFFRDADLFTHLREEVLPTIIDDARTRGNELRLWSAGCATGEEAYSLAILVSELLGPELDDFTVRVFATDLDGDAVAFARRGVYPTSALKNLRPDPRDRYLMRLDSAWEVCKQLRGLVIFGQHDLAQRAPFPRIDLVLCRNVLIYFTPELQRRSLQLFAFALREGGYLVLGKAENTSPLPEHFTLVQPRLKVFRRHGERVLIPPSNIRDVAPVPNSSQSLGRPVLVGMERELARAHARQAGALPASERAEQVLLELPIGVVVVDRNYDIQTINAVARRLLGIHTPALGEDIIHLAHRTLGEPLRDALESALQGQELKIVREVTSIPDAPGEVRFFELTSVLTRGLPERTDAADLIVVTIADATARELAVREQRAAIEAGQREQRAALDTAEERTGRLQQLLDESTRSVRQLLQANQDLTTANAGLRSTNEELLVGNEEAQAAMEEIETLNEEQQATNEELETLNEELQATVEELNATNEDLQARTLELQEQDAARDELMSTLDEERRRLDAVLANMAEAVMVVDTGGHPVLTNAAFKQMFGDRLPTVEDVAGRRLTGRGDPVRMAARGETFTQSFTVAATDGARRWYMASGQPIDIGQVRAGLVVIRDVSEQSLRELQEEVVALASHELRTPLAGIRGSLQLLQLTLGPAADEAVARYIDVGLSQTRVLEDLVLALTDVVRILAGHLPIERSSIDLADLAQTTIELTQPLADGQEIRLIAPAEPITVSGDRRRLQQVLLNLIGNAVEHGASLRGVDVRLYQQDSTAAVEVVDYGPGIAEDARAHVFERFYKVDTDGSGLGLGLYVAHAIIQAHDGSIDVHSTDGRGTTVVIRLPLAN